MAPNVATQRAIIAVTVNAGTGATRATTAMTIISKAAGIGTIRATIAAAAERHLARRHRAGVLCLTGSADAGRLSTVDAAGAMSRADSCTLAALLAQGVPATMPLPTV